MPKNKINQSIVVLTPNSNLPLTNKRLKKHVLKELKRISSIKNPSPETLDNIQDLSAAAKFLEEDNGIAWKDSNIEFLMDVCWALEFEKTGGSGEFITFEELKKQLDLDNE
jgi:hypothetical protein